MQTPYLSIVIPIKNEQDNIKPLVEKIHQAVKPTGRQYEIIFVDDGSTDRSLAVLKGLMPANPQLRVVQFDRNYGQTAALEAGFRRARGRIIAVMDGDGQNDPADIPRLVARLEQGPCHIVLGVRVKRHDNIVRKLSSLIANTVRNWVVRDSIHDAGCAMKVFYRECLEGIELFEGMHRFIGTIFLMHGFKIAEVPVRHHPRLRGKAKYGIRNRLWKTIKDLLAVRWMQRRCLRYRVKQFYTAEPE